MQEEETESSLNKAGKLVGGCVVGYNSRQEAVQECRGNDGCSQSMQREADHEVHGGSSELWKHWHRTGSPLYDFTHCCGQCAMLQPSTPAQRRS